MIASRPRRQPGSCGRLRGRASNLSRYSMWRWLLLTGCLLAGAGAAEAAKLTSPFRVANWSGGALADDQTKAFDRCVATTQDAKGTSITYSINHEFRWGVALSNPSWNFIKGAALSLILRMGQEREPFNANAMVTDRSVLELQVKDPIALFSKLRNVRELRVVIGGLALEMALTGGDEVLSALTQCALRATRFRQNPKLKEPLFVARDPGDTSLQEEARTIVAHLVAYAALRDSQMLTSPESFAEVPADIAWKGGLVTGGLTVLNTQSPIEPVENGLIERGIRTCRGGFFFASVTDTIDQTPTERIFTTCQTPESTTTLHHMVIERPKGGFYLLSLRSVAGGFSGIAQRALDEYEERIRAVIMVAIKKLE